VAARSQAANQAAASGKAWTGVVERVHVKLAGDGAVARTPSQHTRVSASGTSPVTISVPVSGTVSKRKKTGGGSPVVHHQVQVSLSPDGSAHQLVKSQFKRALPVDVKVKYTLDGTPVPASQINGKSGTVTVTYTLSNVSQHRMSACFEGFDGQQQHITLQTPLPILAWLSFTVPSEAQTFSAPGSSLSPDSKGVSVGWTAPLFEPFGPTKRTFTLTMKTSQAVIPQATIWLDTVSPFTLTGKAPSASAQALGVAASAVAKGESAVRTTLATLQRTATSLETTTSRSSGSASHGHSSGNGAGKDTSDVLGRLLVALDSELSRLSTVLTKQSSQAAGVSASAKATATLSSAVDATAAEIGSEVDQLTAQQSIAVQKAGQEVQQLEQLSTDLQALPPSMQSTPEVVKLVDDLALARTTAGTVATAVANVEQIRQSVADHAQDLQHHLTMLVTQVDSLESAAAALSARAHDVAQQRVATIDHHFAEFRHRFAAFQHRFAGLQDRVAAFAAGLEARLEQARATARRDLAHLLLEGERALQSSAEQAQAQLAQTQAQTEKDVTKANQQYAMLLTLDQQADLYQLPGGTAPDVTEQSGIYIYKVSGTSGHSKRVSTRQDRRNQRQEKRHERRQHRQERRQQRRANRH
jgi:hypothetical protein